MILVRGIPVSQWLTYAHPFYVVILENGERVAARFKDFGTDSDAGADEIVRVTRRVRGI